MHVAVGAAVGLRFGRMAVHLVTEGAPGTPVMVGLDAVNEIDALIAAADERRKNIDRRVRRPGRIIVELIIAAGDFATHRHLHAAHRDGRA